MFTLINMFDPSEIDVLGFATTTLEQLEDAFKIEVKLEVDRGKGKIVEGKIAVKIIRP